MIQIGGETGKLSIFDDTFEHDLTQRQVFVKSVLPLVEACLHGYNATVLAVSLPHYTTPLIYFEK